MLKKASYLLPFLTAIFCTVSLYAANAERLPLGSMLGPLIFSLLIAGFFLVLAWLCHWTNKAAPLVAAAFTLAFLSWYRIPWFYFAMLLIVTTIGAPRLNQRNLKLPNVVITLIMIFGILTSSFMAIAINSGKTGEVTGDPYEFVAGQPNVYFIVPDRMPNPAAMRESGIDPNQMISELNDLGFYVPENKISQDQFNLDYKGDIHTTRTMRFFASALNNGAEVDTEINYQKCRSMIRDNDLFYSLHDQGYQIVNYASWFTETSNFSNADMNEKYGDVNIIERFIQNELGEAMLNYSVLRGFPLRSILNSDDMEIRRHRWQADGIIDFAYSGHSSTFIMSHIMLPHEPFVYAESGMTQMEQYYANIRFAISYLTNLAKQIREADPTGIVIIQSDEGMAFQKPPEINRELSENQWSGVFTAWYIPPDRFPYTTTDLDEVSHTKILDIVLNQS